MRGEHNSYAKYHDPAGKMPCWPRGVLAFALVMALTGGGRAEQAAQRPELCINIEGHTAPIMALAFSADSATLFTAGLDKAVHAWRLPDGSRLHGEASASGLLTGHLWAGERTLRWSIGRGQRGSIYALAVRPETGDLAIAGYGARGTLGDIALLDPVRARVVRVYEEHRETVTSLGFTASGKSLASIDRGGRLLLWPAEGGKPRTLCASDAEIHGPAIAKAIAASLRLRPLAVAGDQSVAAPAYSGPTADGKSMIWRVRLYDLATGKIARTLKTAHYGAITALCCTADGRYVASADLARQLVVWDMRSATARRLPASLPVVSLAFSPRGDVLVAGTASSDSGGSQFLVWDVNAGRLRRKRSLTEPVYACAVSPDGQKLAYVGGRGHDVLVEPLEPAGSPLQIAGGWQVTTVGIVGDAGDYRIVYGTSPEPLGTAKARGFDPAKLQVGPWAAPVPTAAASYGQWQAVVDRKTNQVTLYAGGASMGTVQPDRQQQGIVHSCCWIPDGHGSPAAIAIGTNVQCGVYVYGLPEAGPAPLLRYFRGHSDLVSSLAASSDGRILVSGSRDGTVRCWSMKDLQTLSAIRRRWGGELVEQKGQLIVATVDEFGPLHRQQVLVGDAVTKILWPMGETTRSETQPDRMLGELAKLPWYTQVSFLTSRQGKARPPLNLVGGWHELLALYTTDRDWVAWTPSGYYACSGGGERLIGWQINSDDLLQTTSFFSADKFNKVLYRPDVIRGLLKAGTATAAVPAGLKAPRHVDEIRPPAVKIVVADQRRVDRATRLRVVAMAESKDDSPLVAMQLLLDGRPYGESRSYAADDPENRKRREDWLLELTPGPHRIAVQAENDKSCADDEIEVTCPGEIETGLTLRCLSVGVSAYSGNQRLRFGHSDAKALASILESNARGPYSKVEVRTLVDAQAGKHEIEAGLAWLKSSATWKDVSVFFFAGHGVNIPSRGFFLFPPDGSLDRPEDSCISDAMLREFCQHTPGKVIVLLDACRAASLQIDVNSLALKLSRDDCGAIVITSCTGNQASLEAPAWNGGAFTRALVDGLEGRADLFNTGFVSSPYDIACYVDHVVRSLTNERQTPICASPRMPQFRITRATVH